MPWNICAFTLDVDARRRSFASPEKIFDYFKTNIIKLIIIIISLISQLQNKTITELTWNKMEKWNSIKALNERERERDFAWVSVLNETLLKQKLNDH